MKLTEAQAKKVVSDIYEQIHGEQLYHFTVRKFLSDWMANKKNETSNGTHKRYQNAWTSYSLLLASGPTGTLRTSTNAPRRAARQNGRRAVDFNRQHDLKNSARRVSPSGHRWPPA